MESRSDLGSSSGGGSGGGSGSGSGGGGRTLAKLEAALAKGQSYEALQLYRTQVKRKLDGGKLEEGCSMVAQGASALVASGRPAEASDLVDMLIKSYDAQKELLDEANVGRLCDVAAVFPATSAPACAALAPVLRAAARWAEGAPLTLDPSAQARPEEESEADSKRRRDLKARVHAACAAACSAAGAEFAADAQRHFLEAQVPKLFAEFLFSWASTGGYAGEADLFLARAVLQQLVLGKLGEANAVRDGFLERAKAEQGEGGGAMRAALESPLANFIKFLLLCCEVSAPGRGERKYISSPFSTYTHTSHTHTSTARGRRGLLDQSAQSKVQPQHFQGCHLFSLLGCHWAQVFQPCPTKVGH